MKLKKSTIEVIKNFATINPGIKFDRGNVLKTISPSKSLYSRAVLEDEFEKEFAIYSINEFLSVLGMFSDPDVIFHDNYFTITENGIKVRYLYTPPAMITSPPDKEIKLPDANVVFTLSKDNLKKIQDASKTLGLDYLFIDQNGLTVKNFNRNDNSDGNNFRIEVDFQTDLDYFENIIKVSQLKLINSDYKFECFDKAVRLTSIDNLGFEQIEYVISIEKKPED